MTSLQRSLIIRRWTSTAKVVEEQLKADTEAQQNSDKINGILNQIYSASTINGYPEEVVNYRTAQMKAYCTQIRRTVRYDAC